MNPVQSGGLSNSSSANWGKSALGKPVEKPFSVEGSPAVGRNAGVESAPKAAPAAPAAPVKTPTEVPKQGATPSFSRPMSETDIVDLLFKLQQPPTSDNKKSVATLLKYGLPVSSENFDSLAQLVKGKTPSNSTESAVISLLKGVADVPKSVDILSSFLSNPAQVGKLMDQVQQSMQKLQTQLILQRATMEPPLYMGIQSVIANLDDQLKKLMHKTQDNELSLTQLNRKGVFQDFKLFADFLGGLDSKLSAEDVNNAQLKQSIQRLKENMTQMLDNIASQAILSKESKTTKSGQDLFAYWQVPNPFSTAPKTIELLIKKDPQKKGGLNPGKTRIVLKFNTDDLGDMAVTVDIENQKVWYLFHTDRVEVKGLILKLTPELKDRMEALNYTLAGVQAIEKKLDIKQLLLPTLNLDNLSRVSTEI